MKIVYINTKGNLISLELSIKKYPLSLFEFKQYCPDYLKSYSVVVNDSLITKPDFKIKASDRIYLVPKATFDIKAWRAQQALNRDKK